MEAAKDKKVSDTMVYGMVRDGLGGVPDSNGVNLLYAGIPYPRRNAPISRPPEDKPVEKPTEPEEAVLPTFHCMEKKAAQTGTLQITFTVASSLLAEAADLVITNICTIMAALEAELLASAAAMAHLVMKGHRQKQEYQTIIQRGKILALADLTTATLPQAEEADGMAEEHQATQWPMQAVQAAQDMCTVQIQLRVIHTDAN